MALWNKKNQCNEIPLRRFVLEFKVSPAHQNAYIYLYWNCTGLLHYVQDAQ